MALDALRGLGFKACLEGRIVRFLIENSISVGHSFLIFQKIIFFEHLQIYSMKSSKLFFFSTGRRF